MQEPIRTRRSFLGGVGLVWTGLIGTFPTGNDAAPALQGERDVRSMAATDGCTPGHSSGDAACQQVADDATVLTGSGLIDSPLPVGVSYPCGWATHTGGEYDDRVQVTVSRANIGEIEASVAVQVRVHDEPVGSDFIDSTRHHGHFREVDYRFAGEERTGLVTPPSTAEEGTTGHAVVPIDTERRHVEFVSSMSAADCGIDPRPDYAVVRAMLTSLASLENPRIDIVSPVEAGEVVVYKANEQTITGSTSLPDGSRLTMTLRSSEPTPLLRSVGAGDQASMVVSKGRFAATFDLSDVTVGQQFSVTVTDGADARHETSGSIARAPSVTMDDQVSQNGKTVTVSTAIVPDGGFIAIHDAFTLKFGDPVGSLLGSSGFLSAGEKRDVRITLDEALEPGKTDLIAMLHQDTNENGNFDFASSGSQEDAAYTYFESRVTDQAAVKRPTATGSTTLTPTATETTTTTTTTTTKTTPTPTTTTTTPTPTTRSGGAKTSMPSGSPDQTEAVGGGFTLFGTAAALAGSATYLIGRLSGEDDR